MNAAESTVRPAAPSDAYVLVLLLNSLQEPHFHTTAARLEHGLAAGQGDYLVAERDGKLLGCATLRFPDSDPGRAWVGLFVHPDHREDGTPEALHAAAVAAVREQGVFRLWTSVRADYLDGYPFLARLGYREVHRTFGGGFFLDSPVPDKSALEAELGAQGVHIRPAADLLEPEHSERLAALYAELLPDKRHAEPTIPKAGAALDDPELLWNGAFVATLGGELVGMAVPERSGLGAWNAILGVRREHRRRGIGTVLQARVAAWAREAGITFLNTAGVKTDDAYLGVLRRLGANIEPDWVAYTMEIA